MWKTGTNLCDMINHRKVNRHMKGVANPLPVKASREPNGSGVPKFIQRRLPNRSLNPFAPGLQRRWRLGTGMKWLITAVLAALLLMAQTFAGEHPTLARVTV